MAKQITSGPSWRNYADNSGNTLGWALIVAGIFFGVLLMFRPPDAQGVAPGPIGPIMTFVVFCTLSVGCFAFHSHTLVDQSKGSIELFRGWGQARASETFPLTEFRGIVVGGTGTRSGVRVGYRLMLDRGALDARNLVLADFDRKTDAETEAQALAELIGLPVIQPNKDPLAYRKTPPE